MTRRPHHRSKTLYILRGLPGTGKTAKARELKKKHGGVIISADDYFRNKKGEIERINPQELHKAHVLARKKALEAMDNGMDPVIIDNTNMARWEMFPYAQMGFHRNYWIKLILRKDTWRVPLEELYEWCNYNIPLKKLENMKMSYQPVRHLYDILYDEESQKWWSDPENNDW